MRVSSAVVGGFILGALGLAVAAILFFGTMQLFGTTARFVVFFSESVAGLDVGAPVTFHGVRVGSVENIVIQFSTDTMSARVPVFLELQPTQIIWEGRQLGPGAADVKRLVETGLRAQLAVQSVVTGQLRVDLDFRPDTPAQMAGKIEGVAEIPTVPSELGQLRNELTKLPLRDVVEAAHGTLVSLGRLADHLDARLDPLVDSASHVTETAARTLQTTEEAVRHIQADASSALHVLESLFVDAHRQLDARGGELSRALSTADRAVRQAETLIESLNALAEPNSPFRGDLEASMHDLAAIASSLRTFAETLERNPNALLIGRSNR